MDFYVEEPTVKVEEHVAINPDPAIMVEPLGKNPR